MHDPLEALRSAGCPVDLLSSEQRAVLASLTPEETTVLVNVQEKLTAAEGEVVGHDLKML
ncbi:aroma-sacti cluster domain-containing protein [Actinoplanes sp. NPDC051346]|uniref:aroma-sacti cluster domain-containing protein n=1 Tax=Actinoplanes sp. NPDC051346 TaxID=3155048 RepID=UPI00341B320F